MYSRETIEELNAISKLVYGSKSRWRKLVEKGELEPVMEDTKKLHLDGSSEMIKTQVMHAGPNGGEVPKYTLVRYTPKSVKEKMLNLKAQIDGFMEMIRKQQEEQKAKAQLAEDAKVLVQSNAGSAAI
jgi:hypothetical protein